MKTVLNFIVNHWEVLGVAAYEIIARVIPTKWNISILDNGWKILDILIRNKRTQSGNETGLAYDQKGKRTNRVDVPIDKHILFILLLVCVFTTKPGESLAQNPNNQFAGIYITDPGAVDTTLIKNARASIAVINGPTGGIMFDKTNNKWRVWNPALGIWSDWNVFNTSGLGALPFWKTAGTSDITDDVNILPTVTNVRSLQIGNTANRFNNILSFANQEIAFQTGVNDISFSSGQNIQLNTNAISRLRIEANGAWAVNNITGTAGQAIVSNGASSSPTWQTVGTTETASNGLTKVVNDIRLGGNLTTNTTIGDNGGGQFLSFGLTGTRLGRIDGFAQNVSFDGSVGANFQVGSQSVTLNTTSISLNGATSNVSGTSAVNLSSSAGILSLTTNAIERLRINNNGSMLFNGLTGTAGQALVSNGSLTTPTWQSISSTPAGSNTQVQFNNGGVFGADADLTFATDRLTATNLSVSSLTSGRIPLVSTSGSIIDNTNLQYIPSTGLMNMTGTVAGINVNTNGTSNIIVQGGQITQSLGSGISIDATGTNGAVQMRGGTSGAGRVTVTSTGNIEIVNSVGDAISMITDSGGISMTLNNGGDFTISTTAGTEVFFNVQRTTCAGAPSGAAANISGVLNICP